MQMSKMVNLRFIGILLGEIELMSPLVTDTDCNCHPRIHYRVGKWGMFRKLHPMPELTFGDI